MAAMVATTARGPLMPRPTTAMVDTALAMAAMAPMVDTARGPLTPRPTMALVDSSVRPAPMVHTPTLLASALLMPRPTTAMVDTALAMAATEPMVDTARGPLIPRPSMAMVAMEATVTAVDTPGASKSLLVKGLAMLLLTYNDTHRNQAKIFRQ